MKKSKKYNYFYKITNILNNHFYYGIHSTDNLNDGYMGSGVRLRMAYKKYGIENFTKEILKFFNTRNDAAEYESEIVTETLIKDVNCYNVIHGGETKTTTGTATVKDFEGNIFQLPLNDDRIINNELVGVTKGFVTTKNENGEFFYVSTKDERYLSGELSHIAKGTCIVKDKNNNRFKIDVNDERFVNGEVNALNKNKVLVKDKKNKCYIVEKTDKRLLSGELTLFWKGRQHSVETKEKQKKRYKDIKHQQGEKNSQYGTCWITKDGNNKKIKKDEIETYLLLGWIKGRKIKK